MTVEVTIKSERNDSQIVRPIFLFCDARFNARLRIPSVAEGKAPRKERPGGREGSREALTSPLHAASQHRTAAALNMSTIVAPTPGPSFKTQKGCSLNQNCRQPCVIDSLVHRLRIMEANRESAKEIKRNRF